MGYVHTYRLTEEIEMIPAEALTKIQEVIEKYKDILRLECDEDKEPLITKEIIRFNGYKDKGYETFYFSVKELYHFCKTNARDYDLPICIIVFVNPKVHHLSIEKYTTLSKKIIAPSATFQFL